MNNKKKADEYYNKKKNIITNDDRPNYHFTPDIGWMNDPNGFSIYNGDFHLFYQYNPYDTKWGAMHWGHAKTEDFIEWKRLSVALAPDDEFDGQCFSGSSIVDENKHILIYTTHKENIKDNNVIDVSEEQAVVIGDGFNYKALSEKIGISSDLLPINFEISDFRDPKIWKENDIYYTIVAAKKSDGNGAILGYTSTNLLDWKYKGILYENNGEYGKMWECPDFIKSGNKYILIVSVIDMQEKDNKYFKGHQVIYFIGEYDRENFKFIPSSSAVTLDYGFDYYAQQSIISDDKIISIAWLNSWLNPNIKADFKWCGQMTYPRILKIKDEKVYQIPYFSIEKYYTLTYQEKFILDKNYIELGDKIDSISSNINLKIKNIDSDIFKMNFYNDKKNNCSIEIDFINSYFRFIRVLNGIVEKREIILDNISEIIDLRILLDKYSIEIFVNRGEKTFTAKRYTDNENHINFSCDKNAILEIEANNIKL